MCAVLVAQAGKAKHMQKLVNYSVIGFVVILVLIIGYISFIQDQKEAIQIELEQAQLQITRLINTNKHLNHSIDQLEEQAKQHRAYTSELETKRKATQQQANSLIQQFKRLQHEDKTINSWADTPLPSGLY